jgi:non-heme chloroperoxidase
MHNERHWIPACASMTFEALLAPKSSSRRGPGSSVVASLRSISWLPYFCARLTIHLGRERGFRIGTLLISRLAAFLFFSVLMFQGALSAAPLSADLMEKSFVTSDRVRLTYLTGGTGEIDLIFIPGWLMPAEIFQSQLDYFSKKYRVHSLNPRSQGTSDIYRGPRLAERRARDIREFIAHLKTKRFVLLGWSLGVMESLDYLTRYGQEGLMALVMIDNSIGEGDPPKARKTARAKMTEAQFTKYIKEFSRAIFKTTPNDDFIDVVEKSGLRLAKNPADAFNVLSKPYGREYYRDAVYATTRPVWYAITPRFIEQSQRFIDKHPQGQTKIYNDAGHALFVDAADEFNRDLEAFLLVSDEAEKISED